MVPKTWYSLTLSSGQYIYTIFARPYPAVVFLASLYLLFKAVRQMPLLWCWNKKRDTEGLHSHVSLSHAHALQPRRQTSFFSPPSSSSWITLISIFSPPSTTELGQALPSSGSIYLWRGGLGTKYFRLLWCHALPWPRLDASCSVCFLTKVLDVHSASM